MKTKSILPLTLLVLAIAGSATESFAWDKHFTGTRAQVVNACSGANMVLINGATNSTCKNLANGNYVDCNDAGQCSGGGPGPDPTRLNGTGTIRGGIFGDLSGAIASADTPTALTGSIVDTILKWNLKKKKKLAEEPAEDHSSHESGGESGGRDTDGNAPEDAAGADDAPQWHSNAGTIL